MRGMDKVVELYRDLCRVPTVVRGRIIPHLCSPSHGFQVESTWSQMDIARNDKVKYVRSHYVEVNPDGIPLVSYQAGVATETNAMMTTTSPSGKLRAILRKTPPVSRQILENHPDRIPHVRESPGGDILTDLKSDVTPAKKCGDKSAPEAAEFLEVWRCKTDSRESSVNLKLADRHGKVHGDEFFGCLKFSQGEGHLLYSAERKVKSMSFFDPKYDPNDLELLEKEAVGDDFLMNESWGEQLTEVVNPQLCLFDVPSGNVTVLDNSPKGISPAFAVWAPNDTGIVCVGFETHPRKLGIEYCTTIKSFLYYYELSTGDWRRLDVSEVSPCGNHYSNPIFSPDGSKLLFFQCPALGPHRKSFDLMKMDWASKKVENVVPITSAESNSTGFVGFYNDTFPTNCWADDNDRVVLSTFEGSKSTIEVVNVETKRIAKISDNQKDSSWTVLDVQKDLILAQWSSPDDLPRLVVGKLPPVGKETEIKWLTLSGQNLQLEGFTPLEYKVIQMKPIRTDNKADLDFEAIFVHPSDPVGGKIPLMVKAHGGPHSVSTTEWNYGINLWTSLGYAVVSVNYRGSLGFGAESIASLPGYVGTEDIQDVQTAVEKVLTDHSWLDRSNVFVYGGSHGGFIAAHLIGQFPDFYKACVALNPVIDISGMVSYTDIPDWCVNTACGLSYDFNQPVSPEMSKRMWERSPIRYASKVKTPLLMILGADDLRVPPKHQREYLTILKANGTEVKVLWYPENDHPCNKTEPDWVLNMVKWFEAHMD